MVEPLGQPGDDPDRGLDAAGPAQKLARGLTIVMVFGARASLVTRADQPGHERTQSSGPRRPGWRSRGRFRGHYPDRL